MYLNGVCDDIYQKSTRNLSLRSISINTIIIIVPHMWIHVHNGNACGNHRYINNIIWGLRCFQRERYVVKGGRSYLSGDMMIPAQLNMTPDVAIGIECR